LGGGKTAKDRKKKEKKRCRSGAGKKVPEVGVTQKKGNGWGGQFSGQKRERKGKNLGKRKHWVRGSQDHLGGRGEARRN